MKNEKGSVKISLMRKMKEILSDSRSFIQNTQEVDTESRSKE